jgi:hypothetical protein
MQIIERVRNFLVRRRRFSGLSQNTCSFVYRRGVWDVYAVWVTRWFGQTFWVYETLFYWSEREGRDPSSQQSIDETRAAPLRPVFVGPLESETPLSCGRVASRLCGRELVVQRA